VGCKKAREFLAQKKVEVKERNLIKEPLGVEELTALAAKAGGAENLVAPKRRAEAEGLSGKKLIAWLAADGGRVRRPIIVAGGKLTLGFTEETRRILDEAL
jgi:arsenate reductase-like glutaredoxin family protein